MGTNEATCNVALLAALEQEQKRSDPRKVWLILKGGTLPLVMDAWRIEHPAFRCTVITDYTQHGEIRMMVNLDEIVAVKFYEH